MTIAEKILRTGRGNVPDLEKPGQSRPAVPRRLITMRMFAHVLMYSLMMFAHLQGANIELHTRRNYAVPVVAHVAR